MPNVVEFTLDALSKHTGASHPLYASWLREVFAECPPPHAKAWYGNMYRSYATRPDWFANSLAINSEQEGYGSRRIWEFSRKIGDNNVAGLVQRHATDESRHSKMFYKLLDTLFPSALANDATRERIKGFSPGFTKAQHPDAAYIPEQGLSETEVIEDLVIINFTEIRALVLQYLLRPMLQRYADKQHERLVTGASDTLIGDELNHIDYSAACIERYARANPELVREVMHVRQKKVNEEFLAEVEAEDF